MKFDYVRYEVNPSRTVPSGIVYRPELPVRLIGPDGELFASALVDTGADESIFPRSIAPVLGVRLDDTSGSMVQGVTGQSMRLSTGEIDLEILEGGIAIRWRTVVSFADFPSPADECIIFGHAGGLERFRAVFDGEMKQCQLIPLGL